MSADVKAILRLEVPVIVRLGVRTMKLSEVLALMPGSIIELPKSAGDELDLMINNKQIGCGTAVKIVENFGIRITYVGDLKNRIEAMGAGGGSDEPSEDDLSALADSLLAGQ